MEETWEGKLAAREQPREPREPREQPRGPEGEVA